jgi:hypothetical protein
VSLAPFDIAALSLLAALLVARGAFPRKVSVSRTRARRMPWKGLWGALLIAFVTLCVRHHANNPAWTPHGADWDLWCLSAEAWRRDLSVHPPSRWPLFGLLASVLDRVVPGPTLRDVQLSVLLVTAGGVSAVWFAARVLLHPLAGWTALVLTLALPWTQHFADWTSAYPLWAASCAWAVAGLAGGLAGLGAPCWLAAGCGLAGTLATVPQGFVPGALLLVVQVVGLVAAPGRRLRNAVVWVVPLALVAAIYVWFPMPIQSLQGHVLAALTVSGARQDVLDGWVFGRAWGPASVLQLGADLRALQPRFGRPLAANLAILQSAVNGARPFVAGWMVAALFAGVAGALGRRGARREALPWLAIGAVATVAASVWTVLNLRYLVPLFLLAPLVIVAPLFLAARDRRGLPVLSALSALLLMYPGGSPFRRLAGWVDVVDAGPSASDLAIRRAFADWPIHERVAACLPRTAAVMLFDSHDADVVSALDPHVERPPLPDDLASMMYVLLAEPTPAGMPEPIEPMCPTGARMLVETLPVGPDRRIEVYGPAP